MVYKGIYKKNFYTIHGQTISYDRKYFYCKNCKKGFYYLDHILKTENLGKFSPRMNVIISRLNAELPCGKVFELMNDLFGLKLYSSTIQLIGERMGEDIFHQKTCHELKVEDQKACHRFYIFIDGKLVPFRPDKLSIKTQKKKFARKKFERNFHEVKNAVIVKERIDGKQEIYYVSYYADKEIFGKYLDTYIQHLGVLNADEVIVVADGAKWIWNWVDDYVPNAVRINDWYHSVEYLVNAIKSYFQTAEVKNTKEYQEFIGNLEIGNTDEIISILKNWCERKKADSDNPISKAYTYFKNNHTRMMYDEYEKKAYLIGSGRVEGANKSLIDDRFCKSGMAWSERDVNKIIFLRTLIYNKRFKQYLYQRFGVKNVFSRI